MMDIDVRLQKDFDPSNTSITYIIYSENCGGFSLIIQKYLMFAKEGGSVYLSHFLNYSLYLKGPPKTIMVVH